MQSSIDRLDRTEIVAEFGVRFADLVQEHKDGMQKDQDAVQEKEGEGEKDDVQAALNEFDAQVEIHLGKDEETRKKNKESYDKHEHIPTEGEILEEKFNSMVMPMREQSSQYFGDQRDYLLALALHNEFDFKSKSSVEEAQGISDFDRALADFKLHDAFNTLEKYEDIENFRKKVKHMKVTD